MPGFGIRAAAWAARFADPEAVVALDPTAAGAGLREVLLRRARGSRVAVAPLLEDEATIDARGFAAEIVRQVADMDGRRALLDKVAAGTMMVNGRPQGETHFFERFSRELLGFPVRFAETLLVRSWHDARVLLAGDPGNGATIVRRAPLDPLVPDVRPDADADALVVWAPALSAAELGIVLVGLHAVRVPQIVVCAGGTVSNVGARFVDAREAEAALRRARAVIDAGPADPGTTRALARLGIPVAAPRGGADEWLDGLALFDPRSRTSIELAARIALGAGAPREREDVPAGDPAALPAPAALRERGPLVTVIVPTYDRRDILALTLASWERQIYRDLEIVVVNDAGPDVTDLVARFPRARLVTRETNGGPAASCNTGIDAARGDAFIFCGDDDLAFPDHVARLVDALERSGAAIAHARGMLAYVEPADDAPTGRVFTLDVFAAGVADMAEHDVNNAFYPPQAILARRDAVRSAGFFDPSFVVAEDYEYWIRLAQAGEVVHVPITTCAYSVRADGSHLSVQKNAAYAGAHASIYAKHARPERPMLEARRKAIVANLAEHGAVRQTPAWRLTEPLTLESLFAD
ncbi:MAG TPA: glycosyltransferase family 2 protein [Candidatus Baltobacteraceae bacterium]|nr:glycosyltransferase family 2 protein [Candidatus Baltobacteraceae bacterium]